MTSANVITLALYHNGVFIVPTVAISHSKKYIICGLAGLAEQSDTFNCYHDNVLTVTMTTP